MLVRGVGAGFLAALLLAAGCGGDGGAGAASPDGAEIAPADAALFLALNTDFESDEWQTAAELLERFPDGDRLLEMVGEDLAQEGVDLERDVEPALGPEVDFVVLEGADGRGHSAVALMQPRDPAKLDALLAKADEPVVHEEVEGWTVVGESREAIAEFEEARGDESLAETEAFAAAMDELSDESALKLYVNGDELKAALDEPNAGDATRPGVLEAVETAFGRLVWASGEVDAEDDGVHFEGSARVEGGPEREEYSSDLVERVPAGTLAFVSFNNLDDALASGRDALGEGVPGLDRQLGMVESLLGVSLDEDLLPLFAGEGALVVQPGLPIPAISLLLEVEDEEEAMETLDRLAAAATRFLRAPAARETEIAGVRAKEIPLGEFSLFYAAFDETLVVTSGRSGIGDLRDDGDKLADDDAFTAAREALEMPGETLGFAYVNLREGVPLAVDLAQLGGEPVPDDVRRNVEPLESFLVYASGEGEQVQIAGLLGIE